MDAHDIPAFQREDFMPPENEVKARVDFIYDRELYEPDPDKYWQRLGKRRNDALESFRKRQGTRMRRWGTSGRSAARR